MVPGFRLVIISLVALVPSALRAEPCEQRVSTQDLTLSLEDVEAGFQRMDAEVVRASCAEALRQLGCLGEGLDPHLAAGFHRAQALGRYVEGDNDGTLASFRSARMLEPAHALSELLAPEGHPLQLLYEQAAPQGDSSGSATKARVLGDGLPPELVEASEPMLLQALDDAGGITASLYLAPWTTVPKTDPLGPPGRWIALPPDALDAAIAASIDWAQLRRRRLLWAAGGSLLGSAALYGGSYGVHTRYQEARSDLDYTRADTLWAWNNGLFFASMGVAAVGVGLGTGAILTGQR